MSRYTPALAKLALSFRCLLIETRLHCNYDEEVPGVFRAVAIIRHAPLEIAIETCLRVTRRLSSEGERGAQVAVVLKRWLAVVARKRWPDWQGTRELERAAGEWVDPRQRTAEANREEMRMSWKSMQQAIDAVRDEGLEQGLERGLEQGLEQGRREAKLEDLRELVAWRFGAEALVAAELRLGPDPEVRRTQQVMRWAYQADSAESFLRRINAPLLD